MPTVWDEIDNLQIGFTTPATSVNVLATQIYAKVYYTDCEKQRVLAQDFIDIYARYFRNFEMTFEDGETIILHKPYIDGNVLGTLGLDYTNLQFRDIEHYKSYINSLNNDKLTIKGFEYDNAFYKLQLLSDYADEGSECSVEYLDDTWDDVYIISSISYRPIGKYCGETVWEYDIVLEKADNSKPSE